MCYEIDTEVILANVLKKREDCSLAELVKIKGLIEQEIPSVYVDVTRNSVFATIEAYPIMFCWDNNKIIRRSAASDYFHQAFINAFFNESINEKIRTHFEELMEKMEPTPR